MNKLKLSLIGAMVTASAVASLAIQHQTRLGLVEKNRELLELEDQFSRLTLESQRLASAVVPAAPPVADDPAVELAGLRTEAQSLQQQINEAGKSLPGNGSPRLPSAGSPDVPHPPEYWEQLHQMAGGKTRDVMVLAMALLDYASGHGSRIPSDLDQVEPYLKKTKDFTLTGTNEFDLVYQGTLTQLRNIPRGDVPLLRERQTWVAPSGRMAKVYGMANGSGQIVESDDNFQAWEAEHIIVPPSASQPGQ